MDKAILVIDMPSSCDECCLRHHMTDNLPEDWCGVNEKGVVPEAKNRPAWCPLKSIPDKMYEGGTWTVDGYVEDGFHSGWNACIEEILG